MKSKIYNANFVYFISMILFVLVRILAQVGALSFMGDYANFVINLIIQVGIVLLLPLFLFSILNKQKVGKTLLDCSYNKIGAKEIFAAIGLGFVVYFLNIFITLFFNFILSLCGYSVVSSSTSTSAPTIGSLFLSLFLTAVLPAFCEEFLHRGLLLSAYKELGFKKAVMYSSLLFGLLHLNIDQFFFATFAGAVLATATLFSRSIFPAMIIHFINNGINVYLSYASAKGLPSYKFWSSILSTVFGGNIITTFIMVLIIVPLLIFLLVYLLKILLKTNTQKSIGGFVNKLTITEMRREALGDIANESLSNSERNFLDMINGKIPYAPTKLEIPYEILGFYMAPVKKQTWLEKSFLIASLILGSVITLFTFIWGIL